MHIDNDNGKNDMSWTVEVHYFYTHSNTATDTHMAHTNSNSARELTSEEEIKCDCDHSTPFISYASAYTHNYLY